MRKILTVLVLLVCLTTAIFAVGCKAHPVEAKGITFDSIARYEYTGSFSGNGADWLDAIAATENSGVTFTHYSSSYEGVSYFTITEAAYDGISIKNDTTKSSWLSYYANVTDLKYQDRTVDPILFEGETFYVTGVTIDQIPVSKGFKVLFVQTNTSGTWGEDDYQSSVGTEKAVLFSYVGA